MRLRTKIIGNIKKDLQNFSASLSRATKAGVVEGGTALKNELRAQTEAAGLGKRLGNTWQGPPNKFVYPRSGDSKNAAVSIVSMAPHIIAAYDKGGVIRAKNRRFMAVPLPQAQKMIRAGRSGYRITPQLLEEWMGIKLVMVERPGKNPLLVARGVRISGGRRGGGNIRKLAVRGETKNMGPRTSLNGMADVPMFVLVPQISLRKRLDVEGATQKWGSQIPRMIDRRVGKR